MLPPLGNTLVSFPSRHGTLTYVLDSASPEGISLFERAKRRQICLYPAGA